MCVCVLSVDQAFLWKLILVHEVLLVSISSHTSSDITNSLNAMTTWRCIINAYIGRGKGSVGAKFYPFCPADKTMFL